MGTPAILAGRIHDRHPLRRDPLTLMAWQQILYGGWYPIVRTAAMGVLAYLALVLMLRGSGKRTLSKFSAYDFVVTIALGSVLATVIVSKDVALAQGVVALAVLVGLQLVITWLSVRSSRVRALVQGEPALLLFRGEFLDATLRRERVTREEVRAAARARGQASLATIEAIVLETDGTITVVGGGPENHPPSALHDVRGHPSRPRHRDDRGAA